MVQFVPLLLQEQMSILDQGALHTATLVLLRQILPSSSSNLAGSTRLVIAENGEADKVAYPTADVAWIPGKRGSVNW